MSENDFSKVAIEDLAIVLPLSEMSNCPADLTPEGLSCLHCGRCDFDRSVNELEGMGYKVFIVPGSTFVRAW